MPELPEVETVRRGLLSALEGKTIKTVEIRREKLRLPFPDDFAARLNGRRIERLNRLAKYLLCYLDDGGVLIIHLGMTGHMMVLNSLPPGEKVPPPGRHDHVDFVTTDGVTVRYNDPRCFGLMTMTREEELTEHKLLRNIGPDPLGNGFNAVVLAEALKGRNTPIKAALLDQKTIAGLGNIYVSESLFRAGISPKRLAKSVQGGRAKKLTHAIRQVLNEAIAAGGSTLKDHVAPDGKLGYFQHHFKVYGKAGEPCPGCDCDVVATGGISRIKQAGRSTFYCARRQR